MTLSQHRSNQHRLVRLRASITNANESLARQQVWVAQCGGDLPGYIKNYGSRLSPNYSGDGAEAIYAADIAEWARLVDVLARLVAQQVTLVRDIVKYEIGVDLTDVDVKTVIGIR